MNKPLAIQSSASIAELSKALIEFHRRVPKIPKSARNPFLKSRYADLSTILDIVQPVLNDCELVIQQHPTSDFGLTTILSHSSGEWMSSEYRMMPPESIIEKAKEGQPAVKGITPQSIGSVITYQRRYAIGAILSLNIDDDNDGNLPDMGGSGSGNDKPAAPAKTAMELMKEAAAKAEGKGVESNVDGATPPPAAVIPEVSDEPAQAAQTSAPSTPSTREVDGDSTQAQRDRINDLYRALNIGPEAQSAILAKRGLSVLRSLSAEQAATIITNLESKLPHPALQPAATASPSSSTLAEITAAPGSTLAGVHRQNLSGPCTSEQITELKNALIEWEQVQPGVSEQFIAAMQSAGFANFAAMSAEQAAQELSAIHQKNAANFFEGLRPAKATT